MGILKAILLGLIQGITEFLPVSSSGHLAILENLLHVDTNGGILFDVMLHIGTLTSIIIVFRKDITRLLIEACRMIVDLFKNIRIFLYNLHTGEAKSYVHIVHTNYRKLVMLILVASIPTAIIGGLMAGVVERASQTLLFPGVGLLITGILLLVVDRAEQGSKLPRDTSYATGLLIGIAQGVSVFPGISRSGSTITACLLSGFNRKYAVRFSFIISIPAVIGALIFSIARAGGMGMITGPLIANGLIGAIIAAVAGFFCIRMLLFFVRQRKLSYFSYYCFFIGVVAIIGHFIQ